MLIGSHAAKFHFPDFYRNPKDWDYIKPEKIAGEDNHICPAFQYILDTFPGNIAPPEVLYTLKVSHSFWDIQWNKTMSDIRFFQQKGLKLNEELFKLLYAEWVVQHGAKRARLMKENVDFFKDNVQRKYVHDDIHRAIAYYDAPMFEKIKTDKNSAMTSSALFFQLSPEDQLKTCREEIFVTALERFLIPNDFHMHPGAAYHRALKQLVTSMSRGWFPKFIVQNYLELHQPSSYDYITKFKQKLYDNYTS